MRREEVPGEVEGLCRPFRLEMDAMSPRNIGKPTGGIRAAGEDDAFHFCSDRRQRGADIVAAIEKAGALRVGEGLTRRRY